MSKCKRILIIIISFFMIMCLSGKNIQAANAKYGSVDSVNDFYNRVCTSQDENHLKSWRTYLEGAILDKKSNTCKVYVNNTNGGEILMFTCSSSVKEQILLDIKQKLSPSQDTVTNLSNEEKNKIRSSVNEYISQVETSTKGDKDKYIKELEKQVNTIKNSTSMSKEEKDYRLQLYQNEIKKAQNTQKYKDQVEKESKGMSAEDINNKLTTLESKKARLKNMPSSYVEDGKTRDELLEEVDAEIDLYTQKKGDAVVTGDETIYKQPEKVDPKNASSSIDDMINDAKSFISQGKIKYANDDDNNLQNVSNTVYNILLVVGTSLAVIMGAVLGIKLMVSGVEQKAEVKKLLVPYVVGCIVIFGGFGIWKLAVTILQGI